MRLNTEEVQKYKNTAIKKQHDYIFAGYEMLNLIDTIEALQQENERLADETIKLMKENAKNSNKKDELVKVLKQAREALTIVSDYYSNVLNMAAWKTVKEALAAIDKAIGGKEDV